ncbi:MAG TPA: sulfite exporter TauE/SafE family protein [Planctomycetes bacterium]|nr:sulfite exporter TauE/SafE family protein [Planctomycetota bacterium]HIL38029.1 sulfite exporter TauE/SafE family protein [Planctomycetota bacterium]
MTRHQLVFGSSGIVIGAIGAVCGIGGGLFATPLQHYGFKVPLSRSVSTSLVLVFCTALSATIAESLSPDSALRWSLALTGIPAALVAAQFGMRISRALPERQLKRLFALTFVVFGLRMFFDSGAASTEVVAEISKTAYLSILLLGLCAGLVVPVLGIGGGLIMVPGCLLLVPELGFAGARSLSLAIAAFTSLRALWMHASAGTVDFSRGLPLGLGALIGASIGVQLAHLPMSGTVGQILLGLILCVSAWRFGRDALAQA